MRPFKTASVAFILAAGAMTAAAPTLSQAQIGIGISVGFAPPELPYYAQPRIPGYGYIWTPGYWAWDGEVRDYYWVPGTWVRPPRFGLLWTPGYWGWDNGSYFFNDGYWGDSVGYYGGINYGYGYNGDGYGGGRWQGNQFYYNRNANNIGGSRFSQVYSQPLAGGGRGGRVSFNGGQGGVQARPTAAQVGPARGQRVSATPAQMQHFQAARAAPSLRSKVNHGAPPILATPRPAAFHSAGVVSSGHSVTAPFRATAAKPTGFARPGSTAAYDSPQRSPAQRSQSQRLDAANRARSASSYGGESGAAASHTPTRAAAQPSARQDFNMGSSHASGGQSQSERAQTQRAQPQREMMQRAQPQERAPTQRSEPQRAPQERAQPQQRSEPQRAAPQGQHGGDNRDKPPA